jgi:FkbM family methyltransferase
MFKGITRKLKKLYVKYLLLPALKIIYFFGVSYYRLAHGSLIIRKNTTDWNTFCDIFIFNRFNSPVEISPKFIIDAGAYAGYSSIYFHQKYPNAKIFSLEPETSNFEILKENTKNIPEIIPMKAGLWSKKCFLKIFDRGTGHWGFMTKEVLETENYDIESVTIDDLLKKSGNDRIDILKIDIEGSEQELFSCNYESWINKVDVIIVELHNRIRENCEKNFYSAIKKEDWQEYKKGEKVILIKKNNL